ncbi:aspartyl-tRNA synthetase [Meira miltonrushii]|uniref:Probable aspartate--tRNA ligase, cytoplasmic n=1 Tax=Meira miltonrushii TaxID=1280837 RepID=A0A316VAD5_9BASI|nr:aspartyl-tRNA synthetase [Meira miltonrushii]PWN34547.1 aspartyl-tRNA synthetase [Meira miltonrushii]
MVPNAFELRLESTSSDKSNGKNSSRRETSNGTNNGSSTPTKSLNGSSEKNEKAKMRKMMENSIKLRRMESDNRAAITETEGQRSRYGVVTTLPTETVQNLDTLTESTEPGTELSFKARLHAVRNVSNRLAFLILRHQLLTVQGVLRSDDSNITRHMVRWAERLPIETIVFVRGIVQKPNERLQSTEFHNVEILIKAIHVISMPNVPLPFHHYGASSVPQTSAKMAVSHSNEGSRASISSGESTYSVGAEPASVSLPVRMANRVLDLRSPPSQAIFRVQAAVCQAFRQFLNEQGFIEIHTPKLLGGASESGASVFKVDYFGRRACLAQSPQLFKQMCICADFGRVFEIGPVFRAENSNTHRHLTEYTGLDLEMELSGDDYHEAMYMIDGLLKSIFAKLQKSHKLEIEIARKMFPIDDFVYLDETPILEYREGIQMLLDAGYTEENGDKPKSDEDLSTRAEMRLGALVKEKYKTDFYILDKFPRSVRPFYTHPDEKNIVASNSFDIFVRGQEIISGGQRIHLADELENNLNKQHIDTHGLEDYLDSFRLAAPPHAGCGIGLERFVMLFLGLNDIRNASLFPRDPKSLRETQLPTDDLRHPEATTLARKRAPEDGLPSLEKLIANYGDSSNTSWLDDRFTIWREEITGAAVGYCKMNDRCVVIGNPLCEVGQYSKVANAFLADMKKKKLKPIWLLVGGDFESVLSQTCNWNSLSCVVESRIKGDATEAEKKARSHEKNLKVTHVPFEEAVSDEQKKETEKCIEEWKSKRKERGKQVHLTNVLPWQDEEHRSYFFVHEGTTLVAMVILAQLSTRHGYQIKWALDFPNAPNGAIEYAITTAMHTYPSVKLTFGGSAVENLVAGSNIRGVKAKALEGTYHSIVANLHLLNKLEFRKKFGASLDERLWICYPRGGMGPRTIKTILSFFGATD